tara:strand:+ start:28 stop:225 length:198 start_codon:yes stop_codon:yes gene_type:complete
MTALFAKPQKAKPQKSAEDLEQERKASAAAKAALGGLTASSTNQNVMMLQKPSQGAASAKTNLGS